VLNSAEKKSSKLALIYLCGFVAKNFIPEFPALLEEVVRRKQIVIGLILNLEDLFYQRIY